MGLLGNRSEENKFININGLGGQLYLLKTLIRYGHPLLFICQNEAEELFLFNEIKEEPSLLEWGVICTDIDSLEKFIKGEISFRQLYLTCGDNYLVVGATYGPPPTYFNEALEIYVDNDKDASDSYEELLKFYNDDRSLHYYLYDDIGD